MCNSMRQLRSSYSHKCRNRQSQQCLNFLLLFLFVLTHPFTLNSHIILPIHSPLVYLLFIYWPINIGCITCNKILESTSNYINSCAFYLTRYSFSSSGFNYFKLNRIYDSTKSLILYKMTRHVVNDLEIT